MRRHLKDISPLNAKERGDAVIFVVMILSLLFIFTAMLLFMFGFWQKAAGKMLAGKAAQRIARAGLEEAIWYLDNDDRQVDSFYDLWKENFYGTEVDMNSDGIADARWIYLKDSDGVKVGRYAILVEDENSKININYAHSLDASLEEKSSAGRIDLLSGLIGEANALNVVRHRQTRQFLVPSDIKLVHGIGESRYDKIRNLITTYSYDRNIDSHGDYRIDVNTASFETLYALFARLGYTDSSSAQIALNIIGYRDTRKVPLVKTVNNREYIGITTTPYINEVDAVKRWTVRNEGSTVLLIEQGGQYIELFNPYTEEIDIGGWKVKGVVNLYPSDVQNLLTESASILDNIVRGETSISQEGLNNALSGIVPTYIRIPSGASIGPLSYYTIGDLVRIVIAIVPKMPPIPLFMPTLDPSGCQHYEPIVAVNPGSFGFISNILGDIPFLSELGLDFTITLYDNDDNLIEKTDYPVDTPFTSIQKNDPRITGATGWFPVNRTPKEQNTSFLPFYGGEFNALNWILNWPSSFDIKNNRIDSLGELSLIHRGQQWKTLNFWRGPGDRQIIDYLTVAEQPEKPSYGRLNINTASETVLECLPMVDRRTAEAIVNARPYNDISDILGVVGRSGTPQEILSREMTKYGFDLHDNNGDGFIDTEKEKELIFASIVDLITVRSNVFKIKVIGQKVQNIENNGTITDKNIVAEKKLAIWYDREKRRVLYRVELQ